MGESRVAIPAVTTAMEHEVRASITDSQGDLVAEATVRWRLAPA